MPEKFEGKLPSPEEVRVKEAKQRIFEIANNLEEKLTGYGDDEKVVASMGTIGTSVVLEAGKLRSFIHDNSIDAMNSVGMGEDLDEALKKLWGGKLIILTPEQSQKFLAGIQQLLETKPELERFLKQPNETE
ncbi:MAG: hypothetical protein A3B31_02210 [Candidatus Komeilibacteria bacterium RIFCSPLOWO2_01_FULL_53_11]|uniref:Uncharacterized protein n=1 Tax=Candidatus Komeilibacteria bacterium RIFCSPLOWO2_01_FULL_53_11 TaxID=1798552 RepID=A0A1G2BS65_9BACT|nr:MAG: hypothetical protein A3B31_02210 [Candidatus Komeilibacteria bacterium RIFCSPLOWO2_01_FULL_53_11]